MQRLASVFVVVMVLVAGCSAAPTNGNGDTTGEGDIELESENVVTYTNETENASFELVVNHDTESYDMRFNGTVDTTDNLTRQWTVGAYCEVLSDTAYNYSDGEYSIAENETAYTKTTASGETEEVSDLPDEIFAEYEPETLRATLYHTNGTKLNTCTVTGEDEFSHERH